MFLKTLRIVNKLILIAIIIIVCIIINLWLLMCVASLPATWQLPIGIAVSVVFWLIILKPLIKIIRFIIRR